MTSSGSPAQPSHTFQKTQTSSPISPQQPTLAFINPPSVPTTQQPKWPCIFCGNQQHYSPKCSMTREERFQKLRELQKCFKCLRNGHAAKDCSSTCGWCAQSHHRILCPNIWKPSPTSRNQQQGSTGGNTTPLGTGSGLSFASNSTGSFNPAAQTNFISSPGGFEFQESSNPFPPYSVVSMVSQNPVAVRKPLIELKAEGYQTALKCTFIKIFDPEMPQNEAEALVVFDDGSYGTFISTRLRKLLNLNCWGHRQLPLAVFNDPEIKITEAAECKVGFRLSNADLVLPATSVDYLTHKIPFVKAPKSACEFLNASPKWEIGVPEILIGSDFYYEFGLQPIAQHPQGFHLLQSNVGNVIGGRGLQKAQNQLEPCIPPSRHTLSVTSSWPETPKKAVLTCLMIS
uniref:CCHC-type domain-containing protein n=1 Tax=Ditylenchus dipsaci TaxID=166011 RepID=A0A915DC46_9BILA